LQQKDSDMNTTNFPVALAVNGRSHCTGFFSGVC